jgi:tryptophan synthase beta chain
MTTSVRDPERDMEDASERETDRFGAFGGRYVPETLIPALDELETAWATARRDPGYQRDLSEMLSTYVGRPSPLSEAPRLSERAGARVLLKREDLNHTGAHKINNTVGQILLARRMGKTRIIAETGAGQHGVATATVCARYGMECLVYMGEEDMRRQSLNVFRMRLMGATVVPVVSGTRTLKDATSEAIRDWVTNVTDTHYIIGSVVGPAPYPRMVRDLQAVIGIEARAQVLERVGKLPRSVVACVGGGSNAMGVFHAFVRDAGVELVGVEAAGEGLDTDRHSASLTLGTPGVLHGAMSYLLQDETGQVHPAHSVSAGLDYPGVGPEHSFLKDSGRATYVSVRDDEALEGFQALSRLEGIIPALETAHAVAWITRERGRWNTDDVVLLCVSGRGDKDVAQVMEMRILDA